MLLEEILEKENAAKAEIESGDTKKRKAEQDKASADSIRRLAMKRMSQSNTSEALFSFAPREVVPLNYASIASDNGGFKLRWAYNNNRLMFNLTCKTTGWCAVGFTTTADGKRMVNYDIALGGVASNSGYLDVSQLLQSFKSCALGSRTECQFKPF
ncbi:hypothetical protein P5673_002487 [Acropora cervicornis]|uniref:DOMON domain-containing protein n=1 Tax=Acropora cervicornis TaxID=6130 RepID=A0AAD9VF40_ACRCE|nr:hypothetical protein P5673_002487 [Acropora cervicornis]